MRRAKRAGLLPVADLTCLLCDCQAEHWHHPDYQLPEFVTPLCVICHRNEHIAEREAKPPIVDMPKPVVCKFLRVDEVASLLGISKATVIARIKRGDLPGVKLGRRLWRIPLDAFGGMV